MKRFQCFTPARNWMLKKTKKTKKKQPSCSSEFTEADSRLKWGRYCREYTDCLSEWDFPFDTLHVASPNLNNFVFISDAKHSNQGLFPCILFFNSQTLALWFFTLYWHILFYSRIPTHSLFMFSFICTHLSSKRPVLPSLGFLSSNSIFEFN